MAEEGLKTTPNHLIHIGMPIAFDNDTFLEQLRNLMETAYNEDEDGIIKNVCETVATYHPNRE